MQHSALLVPGTLCDGRVFGPMLGALPVTPFVASIRAHDRVATAAKGILADASKRSLGIGFSLGGFVLLEMFRRCPDRFSGIVLLSGNASPDVPSNAPARRAEVEAAKAVGMSAFVETNWTRYVSPGSQDNYVLRGLLCDMAIAVGHEEHARQAEMNIHRPDFRELVAQQSVPLLVVAGAEDALCPRERYIETARYGQLELVSGAGHFLPLEAPERVAVIISQWLDREVPA